MKNKGFTLAELLVALSVVGVIAAMTIPSIHNSLPDGDKAKVLKTYKILNDTNNEIFNNPSLYQYNDNCGQHILYCTARPLDKDSNSAHNSANYEGTNKYPYLLSENLNLSQPISLSGNNYTFVTSGGISWTISPKTTSVAGLGTVPQYYTITIDVGNPKRQSCVYNSSSCKNPGQFQFRVMNDGSIIVMDNLTKAYLMNPNNLNDRNTDLQKAQNLCRGNSDSGTHNSGNEMSTGSNNTSTTTNDSKETTGANASSER